MYSLARVGIIALSALLWVIVRRSVKHRAKLKMVLIIVGAIFLSGTLFLPVENVFFRFQDPKAAFSYTENGKILNITEYGNSASILYRQNDGSTNFMVLKKDSRGWMINNPSFGYGLHASKVDQYIVNYQYVADNIMFVYLVESSPNATMEVQNENDTQLATYSAGDDAYRIHIHYGFIKSNKGFFVVIEGKKIEIANPGIIEPILIIYPLMIALVICVLVVVKKVRKLLMKAASPSVEYEPYKKR